MGRKSNSRTRRFSPERAGLNIQHHTNFLYISLVRRMWRSTFASQMIFRRIERVRRSKLIQTNLNITEPDVELNFHELNGSVNSSWAQRPHPPPRATAGHLPTLSVPGVGHWQSLRCPGAGHLPTPGPTSSFWHPRGFLSESHSLLSEYNYAEDFTEKKAVWLICQGREKIEEVCKGIFSILCMHFFIAYQARVKRSEVGSYRREPTFFGHGIKFLLMLFEEHPFIFIKLFVTVNFTAHY